MWENVEKVQNPFSYTKDVIDVWRSVCLYLLHASSSIH